jgi:hypothetical protein
MNLSNFFIVTAITVLFSLNTQEVASLSFLNNNIKASLTEKTHGGPRTVIQAMTEVVVNQPTATNLYITIVDAEGTIVIDEVSQSVETRISIVGLKKGTYIVKTIDDYEDVQVFTIFI